MNLELHEILIILIIYQVGSLFALIAAVECWGLPTGDRRLISYILLILSSWLFVFYILARKDDK